MKKALILIVIVNLFSCKSTKPNWDELEEFIIYKEKGIDIDNVDNSTDFIKIDASKIKSLFKDSKPKTSTFLWKGHWIAKAKFQNGKEVFIKISSYGNTFYDLENKNLYNMPVNSIELIFNNKIVD